MAQQAIATVQDKGTLEGLMQNPDFMNSLKTVLPKHLTPDRIVKMALVAASRQPLLFKCTKVSVLQSLMKSAELGLDCSGTLGRAYLVPYWNNKASGYECQFIPGYQGLIELARRSGNIARIESRVVYDKDTFTVEYGLDQKLIHIPNLTADRGAVNCVYAVAEMMDGSRQIEIMTIGEIDAIKARSKSKDRNGNTVGPWASDYSEMARKTVIRRLTKYLPLSTELAAALIADDEQYGGDSSAFGIVGDVSNLAEQTRNRVVEMRTRLEQEGDSEPEADITVEPEPEDFIDPTIHERPPDDEPEAIEAEPVTTSEESTLSNLIESAKERIRDITGGKAREISEILGGRNLERMDLKQIKAFHGELDKKEAEKN